MSSINPVGRSMNGIKTIETASLIFTDDNSSLNTSAGIVSAQANSTTALNGKITAVGFNTNDGVLTLTREDTTTITKDLDGRYLTEVDADDIPNLPASKITSGEFATQRIPDLDADKIASGTFATTLIPNLPASIINSGTFTTGLIPSLPYVSVGTAQAHDDETIFGVKTFNEPPICNTAPTSGNHLANRAYVLANAGGGSNLMTTNTTQTITGNSTDSNGDIIVKNFGSPNRESTDPDRITHFYDQIEVGGSIRQSSVYNGGKVYIVGYGSEIHMPSAGSLIRLGAGGKIGISNNSSQIPTYPIHIRTGNTGLGGTTQRTYFRYFDGGGPYRTAGWSGDEVGIYADKVIMAGTYIGVSDVRIKKDIMDLSSGLQTIEQIKPRTYKYRDPKRGDKMTYGFIAQELEEVLPCVIKTSTEKIPNIMKTADVIDGVFTLKEATDLQVGDEIDIYDEDDNEYKVKITEIINDKSFKTDIDVDVKDKYFIYGKYVDDFKAIEHNCLLPIMLKSIQELNARVKELEAKI